MGLVVANEISYTIKRAELIQCQPLFFLLFYYVILVPCGAPIKPVKNKC